MMCLLAKSLDPPLLAYICTSTDKRLRMRIHAIEVKLNVSGDGILEFELIVRSCTLIS